MNHSKETVLKTVSDLFDLVKEKQSKIDELQKQKSLQELEINQIAQANQQWQLKCGELQKRIDGIKKIIREAYESDGNSSVEIVFDEVEQLEQALKGEQQ